MAGAELFWKHLGPGGKLFDVTEGSNGSCGGSYLCEAKVGYDGPTGWGTPNGPFVATGPTATTGSATNITKVEATLNGSVNPNGVETKYYFEYGETAAYGKKTAEASAGAGSSPVAVSKVVTGLTAGRKYVFRVVATNSKSETSDGHESSFTTLPVRDAWSVAANPSGPAVLNGVACITPYYCMGVGVGGEGSGHAVSSVWSGSQWTPLTTAPAPAGYTNANLASVSCLSSTYCVAVGEYITETHYDRAFMDQWNGSTWTVQNAGVSLSNSYGMNSVACVSATFCEAVGHMSPKSGEFHNLIETWNGTEWKQQNTPNPPDGGTLTGVSCTSTVACTAVGITDAFGGDPEVLRWNGVEWKNEKAASKGTTSGLISVVCTSANACIAAGNSVQGETASGFGETWNGTEWKALPIPNPEGGKEVSYYSLACSSAVSCVAVGEKGFVLKASTIAAAWNGTEWHVVATPNGPGDEASALKGVACPVAQECLAVGQDARMENGMEVREILAEVGP